ncbi:MAG TPA: polysaccharide pyruvyl transferase family protein [Clostridiaceae bacterium]|nr:polysaccharide pyruvyl transferase family protein [Clostridiaceae bacterium]
MSNILLITIQNNSNFGNRLQNYALQTIIENMGNNVYNLTFSDVPLASLKITNIQKIKNVLKKIAVKCGIKEYKSSLAIWKRRHKCICFSKNYIHNYIVLSQGELKTYDFSRFDSAVTGSDQVWHNWKRIENELSYYYLDFFPKDNKVAYAPSFGFDTIPKEDLEMHYKGLMGIKHLSCREQDGCDLIHKITGRYAEKVLDPTLLLPQDEWVRIEKQPTLYVKEKYLLLYMLGDVSAEYQSEISKISQKYNLQIIDINEKRDIDAYGISPNEFIWLIHHADTVCTDSFHACVFSILFEKKLRIFKRIGKGFEHMFSRINNLVVPLGLEKLIFSNSEDCLSTTLCADEKAYLEEQRRKSVEYIGKSLAE